jgi:oxygen-independent coproporphyrinogen-3 oxidase
LAQELEAFFDLGSDHVSLYGLTIEPGTRFGKELELGRFEELDREVWLAMYQQVADAAERRGLHRYEIANFARPGFSSRHNRGYWRDRSFVGVGPGAHGQRHLVDGALERRCNPRSVRAWIDQVSSWAQAPGFLDAATQTERLTPERWLREAAMIGLRDLDLGIDPLAWGAQLGLADPPLSAMLERFSSSGILSKNPPFRVQGRGLDRVDAVAAELLNA